MRETTLCYLLHDDAWLMLYRNKKPRDPNAGKWIGVGGGIEPGESVEACLLREVREETGLVLTEYRRRGQIEFLNDCCEDERMHLYTATGWQGTLSGGCSEGTLEWIPRTRLLSLPLWEGDRIFLRLLLENAPYFHLRLVYHGDQLISATLDGRPCDPDAPKLE